MKILYRNSFIKDMNKAKNRGLDKRITAAIADAKSANALSEINSLKKLQGYTSYYRIRVGDYRIGIKIEEDKTVTFIRLLHRRDFYRYFP